jgi:hypothetical protein
MYVNKGRNVVDDDCKCFANERRGFLACKMRETWWVKVRRRKFTRIYGGTCGGLRARADDWHAFISANE